MKSCCGISPEVYREGNWICSECSSVTRKDEQLSFAYLPGYYNLPKEEPKCECGSDRTFGPNNGMHSATMPCPLYKKP